MTELLPQYKVVLVKEQEIEYNHKINSVQDAITLMMDLVLTNDSGTLGAATLYYPQVREHIADVLGESYMPFFFSVNTGNTIFSSKTYSGDTLPGI